MYNTVLAAAIWWNTWCLWISMLTIITGILVTMAWLHYRYTRHYDRNDVPQFVMKEASLGAIMFTGGCCVAVIYGPYAAIETVATFIIYDGVSAILLTSALLNLFSAPIAMLLFTIIPGMDRIEDAEWAMSQVITKKNGGSDGTRDEVCDQN